MWLQHRAELVETLVPVRLDDLVDLTSFANHPVQVTIDLEAADVDRPHLVQAHVAPLGVVQVAVQDRVPVEKPVVAIELRDEPIRATKKVMLVNHDVAPRCVLVGV